MSPQTLTIGNLGLPAKVGGWIAQADIAYLVNYFFSQWAICFACRVLGGEK